MSLSGLHSAAVHRSQQRPEGFVKTQRARIAIKLREEVALCYVNRVVDQFAAAVGGQKFLNGSRQKILQKRQHRVRTGDDIAVVDSYTVPTTDTTGNYICKDKQLK